MEEGKPAQPIAEQAPESASAHVEQPQFENPFTLDDLLIFDEATLRQLIADGAFGLTIETLACALHGAPQAVLVHVCRAAPADQRDSFEDLLRQLLTDDAVVMAGRHLLDNLFWELTYWKTPALYEALTEGERLHPGIFRRLARVLRGAVVLDAGAGSGRATFECLAAGAQQVYAVEPSPGLLRILERKLHEQPLEQRVIPLQGRFDALPLPDDSVDVALSCSAFTMAPEQGGEPGLAELRRVTRSGGKIVIIWPRSEDRVWLARHGFHYVALPMRREMRVSYRSKSVALQCASRFYAHNEAVRRYLSRANTPAIPYSVLGVNPPHDYCWLTVNK